MRSISLLRAGSLALLATLCACGGGQSSSGRGGAPPLRAAPMVRSLTIERQPYGAPPAAVLSTQPVVQIRSNAALDTGDSATVVTASIVPGTGTAGAALGGTLAVTAVAGVATFTNLSIDAAGSGYRLLFSADGMTEVASGTFSIVEPGAALPPS